MNKNVIFKFVSFFTPNSLRVQLLSRSLLILAFLLVLIGILQYVTMREVIYRNKATSMQSQIISIKPGAWQFLSLNQEYVEVNPPRLLIPEVNLAFIDIQGNYFMLSRGPGEVNPPRLELEEYIKLFGRNPEARHDSEQLLEQRPRSRLNYKVVDAGGVEQLLVLQPVYMGPDLFGFIQASTLTGPLKELLVHQIIAFLFLGLLALLFGLFAFMPVLKKTLVPLSNMVDTAEQIDAGNLARRFPTQQGQTEIDHLAESFNRMLERLQTSFEAERETKEQMRRFVSDASHELRTPLTSIHGFLEVLLRGAANNPEQLHKALTSMHGESVRLNKLVHDLLVLTRLDRQPQIEFTEGFMDVLIGDMEPQLRILAGNRHVDLTIEPNLKYKFDADKIKQAILNTFYNAVQHTDPEQGRISIALSSQDNGLQLAVQDNGPGINDTHLPHIFNRFYRIDSSRTRKHGGSGLGLAITKSIVNAHGGTISVESREGEGSTFYIWLPEQNKYFDGL
ncbi:MAG: putative sensor histidine kinase TcrY [Pelotomaculum sp. PtaB.Bin104]|nr:MAG: putative sensor histidine kinase TcrY [Pelotomaculum sp. PtaB.Bin104]